MNLDRKLVFGMIILVTLLLGVAVLNYKPQSESQYKVAGSIFPVSDMLTNLLDGTGVKVVNILPIDSSPHKYEPTAMDQSSLTGVTAVFTIGLDLDNWAVQSATAVNENVQVFDLSENIKPLDNPDLLLEDHEEEEEDHHGEINPHYWLSTSNAALMSASAVKDLIVLYPEYASTINANYLSYVRDLNELQRYIAQLNAGLPNSEIITVHNAFNYLAVELGIEVAAVLEESPGKVPSPEYLAKLGEIIDSHNIKVIFREPQLSDETLKSLAEDYQIELWTLDPYGGSESSDSLIKLIKYNAETLVDALN